MKLRLHIQFRCVKKQVIHRDTRDAHRSYPAAVQDHDFSPLMGHHVARWQFRDEPFSGHTDVVLRGGMEPMEPGTTGWGR